MNILSQTRTKRLILLIAGCFAFWFVWWFFKFLDCMGRVDGRGNGLYSLFLMLNFPLMIGFALAVPLALFLLPFKKRREFGFLLLSNALIYFFCFAFWKHAGHAYELSFYRGVAENAKPLIAAIGAFTKDRGAPPKSLKELVPTYLPLIPPTGLAFRRDFEYTPADRTKYPDDPDPWRLKVELPQKTGGFLESRALIYLPSQNYSDLGWSRSTDRIGDWVYQDIWY